MTQSQALEILKTGANVFLNGEPGSGKTHTINEYVDYLRSHGIEPAITASTGIAATHVNGMTIHSWSGIGVKDKLSKHDLENIMGNDRVARRIKKSKVLIIDEVSMLSPETLTMVETVCRKVRSSHEPFGGLQVILVGDFFQLPPVVKRNYSENEEDDYSQPELIEGAPKRFAFESDVWDKAKLVVCYLTEQYRQSDPDFLSLLSAIRSNAFNDHHLNKLQIRKVQPEKIPQHAPKLFSHNLDVDNVNQLMLKKIPGSIRSFEMTSWGWEPIVATLKKGCLSPEVLQLKVGARVMFTKNNSRLGFCNGTLGEVVGFDRETGHPIVEVKNYGKIEVEQMSWLIEDRGKELAGITQFPLRLAWAITVHKSQGMSLDEAVMDLSQVFEYGQGYVALSRVRELSGLHLLGWNEQTFQVDPQVLAKDKVFRVLSDKAEVRLESLSAEDLTEKQKNLILNCGGLLEAAPGFDKIREEYADAYRPWDEEQDQKLIDCFLEGETSTRDLAKKFGRTKGAIRSRLIKLGLVSKTSVSLVGSKGPSKSVYIFKDGKKPKGYSLIETKNLLIQKMSIAEIASARGLKISTIADHIEKIKSAEPELDLSHIKNELSAERFAIIAGAFQQVAPTETGYVPMGPVKELLGDDFSYDEIRLARLFLEW